LNDEFDVIIVGAGPAGCGLALSLALTDLRIALLDRSDFPRRKVCGGAISERTLNRLKEFPKELNLYQNFIDSVNKTASYGMRLYSPSLKELEFDYKDHRKPKDIPGFVCERSHFDDFMIDQVRKHQNISVITNSKVTGVKIEKDEVQVVCGVKIYRAKIVAGADGANSVVAKSILKRSIKRKNDVGISAHFENVTGFHKNDLIDLYFLKETLPCYFWIFKLPDNKANAGLYFPSEKVIKNKINLKKLFEEIILKYPVISERFKNAKRLDDFEGGTLPVAENPFKKESGIYGGRYVLIGDAAGLIDPITGEGIGNALTSSKYASEAILQCFKNNDFSSRSLCNYGSMLQKKLKTEIYAHKFFRSFIFRNRIILEMFFYFLRKINILSSTIKKILYK